MSIQLNNDQIDFICSLYETDESFRNLINNKIEDKVSEVKKKLEALNVIKSQFESTKLEEEDYEEEVEEVLPSHTRKPRTSNGKLHYSDHIITILKSRPGISLAEIHAEMKQNVEPNIEKQTLSTTLSTMKNKGKVSTDGTKFNMRYFLSNN
jgi:hypothetical protein